MRLAGLGKLKEFNGVEPVAFRIVPLSATLAFPNHLSDYQIMIGLLNKKKVKLSL
jgi:hypothetical protein